MMRNGSWNKRFDYDDNNYDDDQNVHNDGQYNEYILLSYSLLFIVCVRHYQDVPRQFYVNPGL